jgi:hypothetical protein
MAEAMAMALLQTLKCAEGKKEEGRKEERKKKKDGPIRKDCPIGKDGCPDWEILPD